MGHYNRFRGAVIGLVALLALFVATSLMAPWTGRPGGMIGPDIMGSWGILG